MTKTNPDFNPVEFDQFKRQTGFNPKLIELLNSNPGKRIKVHKTLL